MPKSRSSKSRPSHSSRLRRLGLNLRFYWYTRPKTPVIGVIVIATVLAVSGYFLHRLFVRQDDVKHITCLAFNVYFEARGETRAGQLAVAEVTMNRVASRRYPDTVCAVVHQKNWDPLRKRYVSAFSWNELDVRPTLEDETFRRAWEVAESVYYGVHEPRVPGALHFHAVYVKPSWARGQRPLARIGNHLFYK